ncbi:MAG: hypothetical protein MZV63_65715 [Marinilabiliales bacterium]|nr:hypothetical protein [Marinilabiliales bacterium]
MSRSVPGPEACDVRWLPGMLVRATFVAGRAAERPGRSGRSGARSVPTAAGPCSSSTATSRGSAR